MEQEIFKFYKDSRRGTIGHLYEVSNYGNVKIDGVIYIFDDSKFINEYYRIGHFHVHRAVAELFILNPENKPCIDHIDGNKHNNHVSNLRWATHSENALNPNTLWEHHIWTKYEKQQISKNVSEYNSHCHWIHLGDKEKFVHDDYLDYWLDDGWTFGRTSKKIFKKIS